MKNPIFLSLIATVLVFSVTYYYYNYYCDKSDQKNKKGEKNKKHHKKQTQTVINETMVLSSVIAGLATWYIASSYFGSSTTKSDKSDNSSQNGDASKIIDEHLSASVDTNNSKPLPKTLNQNESGMKGGGLKQPSKVPRVDSDDITRSYNLIGSGLNIPKGELKIPKVLIDYKQ